MAEDGPDPVDSDDLFEDDLAGTTSLADALCDRLDAFMLIFILSSMFLVFAVVSSFLTTPGSANNVIAVLNVVGAGFFAAVSLGAITICRFRGF